MDLKIINIRFKKSNNQINPILYKKDLPLMISLVYTTINLSTKSFSSKYNHIYSIKLLINYYSQILKIDLEKEIITGNLYLITSKLQKFIFFIKNKYSTKNINMYNEHLSNIGMFIQWCNGFFTSKILIKNSDIQSILKIHKTPYRYNTNYISLSNDSILDILEVINPNSNQNPFIKRNRIRNYSIITLLMETGLRLGELLKIKTKDFIRDKDGIYLNIENRNKDIEDTRKSKPQLKNIYGVRIIGVSLNTYELIDLYVLKHRKRNKNHSYLFTSDINGDPLSKRSVSNIFKIVSKLLNIKFRPHILRHYFSEKMFEFLIETKKMEIERVKDELRIICGWTMNSNMPNIYAKNYISKLANNHNIQRLDNEKINFTK